MARVSEIMVKQFPEQRMLTMRKTIHFYTEYSDFIGTAINSILPLIEESGAFPSSGLVVCFHNIDLEALDVEIGFQIAQPIEAKGDVTVQILLGCIAAVTIDRGPYEKQDPTLEELMKWIPEHGYEPDGGIYYYYLNGEDQPENEYLTEMRIPVKRKK